MYKESISKRKIKRIVFDLDISKEEEIRTKLTAAKQGGGYVYHSDHSVPSDVSFENYCFAVEMVKKYGAYS